MHSHTGVGQNKRTNAVQHHHKPRPHTQLNKHLFDTVVIHIPAFQWAGVSLFLNIWAIHSCRDCVTWTDEDELFAFCLSELCCIFHSAGVLLLHVIFCWSHFLFSWITACVINHWVFSSHDNKRMHWFIHLLIHTSIYLTSDSPAASDTFSAKIWGTFREEALPNRRSGQLLRCVQCQLKLPARKHTLTHNFIPA